MITVIGIPNCDVIRKTLKWLDAKNVKYGFIDFRKEPLSREEIAELGLKITFDVLVNRRSTTWRDLQLGDIELSDAELVELIEKHPTIMKRPVIVDSEGAVMVGFDEDALSRFVEDQEE